MAANLNDCVLITGATGFIGSAVLRAATRAGFRVRTLARPSSPRANLMGLRVEVVEGDLNDRASVAAAVNGARYVIHTAADYRLWTRDPSGLIETNVNGTKTVMEEALRASVEKIVYTSSVCTIASVADGSPADERRTLSPEQAIGAYKKSKVLAERLVGDMIEKHRLPAVIVNPSAPVGPRDIKPTPTGRIIVEAASGRMPAYVDTGLNLAHVDDVGNGHLAALQRGRIGERYILGGENVTLCKLLATIAQQAGKRPPWLSLTVPMVFPIAVLSEGAARLTGGTPFVTRDSLRMARHKMFFTDEKSRAELGYSSRPFEEGIADAIAWFREAGYIPCPAEASKKLETSYR